MSAFREALARAQASAWNDDRRAVREAFKASRAALVHKARHKRAHRIGEVIKEALILSPLELFRERKRE